MTYVTTQAGANLNLHCSYHSVVVVTGVKWTFTDRNNAHKQINETTNPSKYSGSTYSTPSLTVKSFSRSDEGLYRCIVENYKGSGMSSVINASLAPSKISFYITDLSYSDLLLLLKVVFYILSFTVVCKIPFDFTVKYILPVICSAVYEQYKNFYIECLYQ